MLGSDHDRVFDVDLDAWDLVDAAAPLYVQRGLTEPAERGPVKMIAGSSSEVAQELVRLLREEAKVV